MLAGMTSPADSDAPSPAQRDADSGWGMKIAAGVVALIMVVEFVLPGFVAAGFSRSNTTETGMHCINGGDWRVGVDPPLPPVFRCEMILLSPQSG